MDTSHVSALQNKHAGLERELQQEMTRPLPDIVIVQTLKKRKLRLLGDRCGSSDARRFPAVAEEQIPLEPSIQAREPGPDWFHSPSERFFSIAQPRVR